MPALDSQSTRSRTRSFGLLLVRITPPMALPDQFPPSGRPTRTDEPRGVIASSSSGAGSLRVSSCRRSRIHILVASVGATRADIVRTRAQAVSPYSFPRRRIGQRGLMQQGGPASEPGMSTSWEPYSITEGTIVVLPEGGPYAGRGVIERMAAIGVVITHAVEQPEPRRATAAEADLLGIQKSALVTHIRRTYISEDGRPVETADIVVPDAYCEIVYEVPIGRRT